MAARFWVGGTGTWDGSDTTHWASSSGGAGGQSVPGTGDSATFDGSSGGGTVTINTTVSIQSITCGAFTGTLDFSANNNNVTLSSATGFVGSGAGTRTINLGNGTWTIQGPGTAWNMSTVTGLTFNANSSTINFTNSSATSLTFNGGGLTYNIVSFGPNSSGGACIINFSNTFSQINITAPCVISFSGSATQTLATAPTWAGSAGNYIGLVSPAAASTLSCASGIVSLAYGALTNIHGSGGATFSATNSFDIGGNTGWSITGPTGTSGSHFVNG